MCQNNLVENGRRVAQGNGQGGQRVRQQGGAAHLLQQLPARLLVLVVTQGASSVRGWCLSADKSKVSNLFEGSGAVRLGKEGGRGHANDKAETGGRRFRG